MTCDEFLSQLYSLKVTLSAEGDHLRVSAPKGILTPALREELGQRKTEIMSFLLAETAPIQPIPREGNLPLSYEV
jgi:hypothetical protein